MSSARAVLHRHGRTFAFASHLLSPRHARRAETLYAFCRHVDDLADTADDIGKAQRALDIVRRALLSDRAEDAMTRSFLELRTTTMLPTSVALSLIDGVAGDLGVVRIGSENELLRYAFSVAGTVGVMMCAVLDVHDARAIPFASDLGIAMQLTNIARDVGADARLGRRYLPASWVGELEPAAIIAPDVGLQTVLRDGTRRTLLLAEHYYRSGEAGLGFLPWRARLAILAAARMYRAIGTRVASADYRSWDRRAALGTAGKCVEAARAAGVFLFDPRVHRKDAQHDARLHDALYEGSSAA